MNSITIGIDPGLNGAIAVFHGTQLADVYDMPTIEITVGKSSKSQVSAPALADILRTICAREHAQVSAIVERVGAMPGQGVSSMFAFGRNAGLIDGVCAGLGVAISYVTPQAWQKAAQVKGGKDGSRARAMELFPAHAGSFRLKKHDGRAEAVLIGQYGIKVLNGW